MRIRFVILFIMLIAMTASAETLSLDSCRARALRNNKQLSIARTKHQVAEYTRKAARTKYLPHIDLAGGYMYSSREVSILNDSQKGALTMAGQNLSDAMSAGMKDMVSTLDFLSQHHAISEHLATDLTTLINLVGPGMAAKVKEAADDLGHRVIDAFSTNTHNIFTASAVLTQPIYMGGAITAGNKMADIGEKISLTNIEAKEHDIIYGVDNAYWLVVSLRHKQELATEYLSLVQKLDDDVHKMIKEGVATRADGLKVDVAVNEAEMTKTKVDNGLTLAKMVLCQLCGMDLESDITLTDETKDNLDTEVVREYTDGKAYEHRAELQMLSDAIDLSKQQTKIARAAYMPQIAMMGGAFFTNPSIYNGFERKFKGAFNVGVAVKIPVLDWGDGMYKIRASKCATALAQLEYEQARDMVELQIKQSNFKVREANKNLITAKKNIERAEENLRCATLGFKEGVMQTTDVMAAQTAWMQAKTQKIDAEIDVKMSQSALRKATGEY